MLYHLQRLGLRRRLRETLWSARELGWGAPLEFRRDRASAPYRRSYEDPEPLVSICIGTFNRARLLAERSVPSALGQTYRNIEVIVVGDCCTDETAETMRRIADPRLRFVNLPERGAYPDEPRLRWMVAGTAPVNQALALARGDFITHLDDDDEHAPDRVEKLLRFIRETRSDLVYHPFRFELADGSWRVREAEKFAFERVTTSSIFYHKWLERIPWDIKAYLHEEPGDWNRLRKIRFLGARTARYPEPLLTHYRERNQKAG